MAKKYIWNEFRDERIAEGSIEVVMSDDFTLRIPPMECWPDQTASGDGEALVRSVVGDDDVDTFFELGGTIRLLDTIFDDAQGMSTGK